jgi:NADPH:quinone reductase-like Zn-dependent oxidoreductase
MRQLQLMAHGEPSDVIKLKTVAEPALGQEEVLVSMEAAPLNPSDFLFVRGMYGVRPALPSPVGAEGVGRVTKTGSKVDGSLPGKRVMIVPSYEQGTWAEQVVVPVRNIVPLSGDADPLQLSMLGINPVTSYREAGRSQNAECRVEGIVGSSGIYRSMGREVAGRPSRRLMTQGPKAPFTDTGT